MKKTASHLILIALGGVSFFLYFLFGSLGVPENRVTATATLLKAGLLLALLFLLLGLAAFIIGKKQTNAQQVRGTLGLIFAFGLLFRLTVLQQQPWLSNDIYRYLWDARVLQEGINPYLFAPAAPELDFLKDQIIYPRMSHTGVHSVYPPVLQLTFWLGERGAALLGWNPIVALKTVFVAFDLALIVVLIMALQWLKLDPRWVILYAWHPLPIVEIAGSGHGDGVGVLFVTLAVAFLTRREYWLGTFFLALAFLVKFISVLLLPFVVLAVWHHFGTKRAWRVVILFVIITCGSFLPFLEAGKNLISGLIIYSSKWRFNDAVFSMIFTPVHALLPDKLVIALMVPSHWDITAEVLTTRRHDLALLIAKTMVVLFFLWICWRALLASHHTLRQTGKINWSRISVTVIAAFFLLSPTLQPWYLLWILPLLCLALEKSSPDEFASSKHVATEQSPPISEIAITSTSLKQKLNLPIKLETRLPAALWVLSATVFFSYWVLEGYWRAGIWQESGWVKWVEFGVAGIVLLVPEKYWHRLRGWAHRLA